MSRHTLGPFSVDARTRCLYRDGELTKTPMKTVEVLLALLARPGEVVTKDELMQAAWPDSIVEEGNLTVHVALLRKILGDAAPIDTVPKRGYRLMAPAVGESRPGREGVLRGRYFWNKLTRDALDRAFACFDEARLADAASGEALSGLCDTLLMKGLFGFDARREAFAEARSLGSRAVALAPDSAEAQASHAFSQIFDAYAFEAAGAALDKARTLAPARVEPHLWSAFFHALRGDALRALSAARTATSIDPVSLKAAVGTGFHLYLTQQHEPDLAPLTLALDLEPEFAVAHWALGLACDRLGDFVRAREAHERAVRYSGGSPAMESNLARSLALSGHTADARALLERLVEEGLAPYRQAAVQVALGDEAAAVASLERSLAMRDPWLVFLKVDPMLEPVRKRAPVRSIEAAVFSGRA